MNTLAGLRYGALGLPLAFVALPLYVRLPPHYAERYGVPLAVLGALLLGARLFDAVADPWIGRLVDRWFGHSAARALVAAGLAAVVLAAGFHGLFFPPIERGTALLVWCGTLLVGTYLAYSVLGVVHQAWGARLGGGAEQRARIVAWREGAALAGVLLASMLPALAGPLAASVGLVLALVLGLGLLARAPRPPADAAGAAPPHWHAPLATPAFRRLLLLYLLNGVAAAVPATLVLFFVRDRLQLPTWEPLFLGVYFAAGAAAMPLWLRAVARWGLARSWLAGMALAILCFSGAAALGPGDLIAYTAVCLGSGIALGADLALPGALLAGVIQRAGHGGRLEGAYFGWWNAATKLNLALAAGLALPLLAALGYAPGRHDPTAMVALTVAYALLPCTLKALAALLLWWHWIRTDEDLQR
ncbi:MAG: MFS transporter [Rubrivivax sp.]